MAKTFSLPARLTGWPWGGKARARGCARAAASSPRSPALRQWQVGLFEREGQRWMTASTTSCVSGHGGVVAASNPALLTYTRTQKAARSGRMHAVVIWTCLPSKPTRVPRHSPARRIIPIISFYIMAGHCRSDFTATFDTILDKVLRGASPPGYTARWPQVRPLALALALPFHARAPPLLLAAPT